MLALTLDLSNPLLHISAFANAISTLPSAVFRSASRDISRRRAGAARYFLSKPLVFGVPQLGHLGKYVYAFYKPQGLGPDPAARDRVRAALFSATKSRIAHVIGQIDPAGATDQRSRLAVAARTAAISERN